MRPLTPSGLATLLAGTEPHAVLDLRERGAYEKGHVFRTVSLPRRLLEERLPGLVPDREVAVALVDADGRLAELAGPTLEAMGYRDVWGLDGGLAAWRREDRRLVEGLNVPSKVFGERLKHARDTPEVSPHTLHGWIAEGRDLLIVDARTPEEYRRGCVPGALSVPGGELALRVPELIPRAETTVVVHCGGRTRAYLGVESLRRIGLANPVVALRDGTMGWLLAGWSLERNARGLPPEPSPAARARACRLAEGLLAEEGIPTISPADLAARLASGRRPPYVLDVRTADEYAAGHVAGAVWAPGGQLVQAADEYVGVRQATLVCVSDGDVRAVLTASWLRQMDFPDVRVLAGGWPAWVAWGGRSEAGFATVMPAGLAAARARATPCAPLALEAGDGTLALSVDPSDAYAEAHVPGSGWLCRSRLELTIDRVAPDRDTRLILTCRDGVQSTLATAQLAGLGYRDLRVLAGGVRAWIASGRPVATGPGRLLDEPDDVVLKPHDRGPAAMRAYLAWETALDAEGRSPHGLFPEPTPEGSR